MQSPSSALRQGTPPAGAGGGVSAEPFEAERAASRLRLAEAVHGLRSRRPDLSAAEGLWSWQRRVLRGAFVVACAGVLIAPRSFPSALAAAMAIPFFCVVVLRLAALWQLRAPTPDPAVHVAEAAGDARLPLYTILVPLFREAAVVADLIAALRALDYPPGRLEVMLIVEENDVETHAALRCAGIEQHMQVVVVPEGAPRTKPRAIQYGLQLAHGDYVVVYDAEDAPQPDQLRRALAALEAGGPRMGCVQAEIHIHDWCGGWFPQQFKIEYAVLFGCILPALERLELPVPLGGTSNHFPRPVLDAVGGWDPYNVTEDADLGIRLARQGWHVGVLRSITWEEAPPTFRGWKGQRTRWLKGWMQTYLVHMRSPVRLWRELGARRFVGFQLLMGGMILSSLVHPWFYLLVGLEALRGHLLAAPEGAFAQWLLGIGLVNLVAGYISAIALGVAAVARQGRLRLAAGALMMPLYWLAISYAAHLALWELVMAPFHWQKTDHVGRAATRGSALHRFQASRAKKRSASREMRWRVLP